MKTKKFDEFNLERRSFIFLKICKIQKKQPTATNRQINSTHITDKQMQQLNITISYVKSVKSNLDPC